MRTHSATLRSV